MTRTLAIAVFVCVALLVSRQIRSAGQTSGTDAFRMAMSSWETSENLKVEALARNLVLQSFDRHKGEVANFRGDHRWTGSENRATQTLLAYYLGNVRDVRYVGGLNSVCS